MSDCCSVNGNNAEAPMALACRECGNRSKRVDIQTVRSLVRHLPFAMVPAQYYFCEAPGCDVVYFPFDPAAPVFHQADLLVRVGAKEEGDSGLICYCFGVTRQAIREEIEQTGKSTVGERIKAEVQAGNCACEVKNPSGQCCLGNIVRAAKETVRALEGTTIAR